MKKITSFYGKHDIEMVNMADFHSRGRSDMTPPKPTSQINWEWSTSQAIREKVQDIKSVEV